MSSSGEVNSEIPLSHSSVILGKCSRAGLVLFIFKQRRQHTTETHLLQVQTHRDSRVVQLICLPHLLLGLHGDQEHLLSWMLNSRTKGSATSTESGSQIHLGGRVGLEALWNSYEHSQGSPPVTWQSSDRPPQVEGSPPLCGPVATTDQNVHLI